MKKTIILTVAVSLLTSVALADSARAATVRKIVNTPSAPAAIGAYSQAIIAGQFMFVSSQTGLSPETMAFVSNDIAGQMEQALKNLGVILSAGNSDYNKVIKITMFVTELEKSHLALNVYKKYFTEKQPALSIVGVSSLPAGALVQIEATALVGEIKEE